LLGWAWSRLACKSGGGLARCRPRSSSDAHSPMMNRLNASACTRSRIICVHYCQSGTIVMQSGTLLTQSAYQRPSEANTCTASESSASRTHQSALS
jgi:hypothetical protein